MESIVFSNPEINTGLLMFGVLSIVLQHLFRNFQMQYSILSTCPGHCVEAGRSNLQCNHSEVSDDLENSPW